MDYGFVPLPEMKAALISKLIERQHRIFPNWPRDAHLRMVSFAVSHTALIPPASLRDWERQATAGLDEALRFTPRDPKPGVTVINPSPRFTCG